MRRKFVLLVAAVAAAYLNSAAVYAAPGPFDPTAWPTTVKAGAVVHFVSVDPAAFQPVSGTWVGDSMTILTGGDHNTDAVSIGGFDGVKVTGNYLNVADAGYEEWADNETIDILMQVYGDAALLGANDVPRNFNFLTGTLPELSAPVGGSIPVEAKNRKWNWVLFRITNGERPSDGSRYVGSIPENAQGGTAAGGVNGGTIRTEGVPNLIVRLVAFGEEGAFGEPEEINLFAPADVCDPEPDTNKVFVDVGAGTSDHLTVLDGGEQAVTYEDNVGPAADKRRAVRANGSFMNFGITENFLGKACNDPRGMKICVTYYDDPAFAGAVFGPEAYATDDQTGVGTFPETGRWTTRGRGTWESIAFVISAVNLRGVNTTPLTGGPRLIFGDSKLLISRVDIGLFRTGTHPLAGQDPLPGCFPDPAVCEGVYGDYVEMDLANNVLNGLTPGSSGGDQEMIQEEAGPANDRRMAIRPAMDDGTPGFGHIYMNFAITPGDDQVEPLGPSSQPNAVLAIVATYYDDPALIGSTFRPEVYFTDHGAGPVHAFTPGSIAVALEGTDRWREAYFEIPDMKFLGVNQGPQAAARFVFQPSGTAKIYFTRLQYAVIRPCGPSQGINLLRPELAVRLNANGTVRVSWPKVTTGHTLQESPTLDPAQWTAVTIAPVEEGQEFVVNLPVGPTRLLRLAK